MSGAQIAADIEAALIEAGEAVGDGPLFCTLRKAGAGPVSPHDPTPAGAPTDHQLVAIAGTKQIRDAAGALIGVSVRTLTVNATGATPEKGDRIAVGVAPQDVSSNTAFENIAQVHVNAPAGVPISFDLELEA